jgi:hypothetical protein
LYNQNYNILDNKNILKYYMSRTLKKERKERNNNKIMDNKINKWKKTGKKYNHHINKFGYRNDCSGFVSYIWGLPSKISKGGPRTRGKGKKNLKYWSTKINKNKLRKGDALLVEFPTHHVVLFDKWANSNKTKYYGYEMCNIKNCRNFKYHKLNYPYTHKIRPGFKNPLLIRKSKSKINQK